MSTHFVVVCKKEDEPGKTINYAVGNKRGFMNYLLDDSTISKNLSEKSIRAFIIGRKN
ncbi:IS66 family transposase [Clostridium sp.]|uniref:IS66 family transposase n=1 Tax=Clostridium sp. TaxID=1506 RepID=UPI003DA9390A